MSPTKLLASLASRDIEMGLRENPKPLWLQGWRQWDRQPLAPLDFPAPWGWNKENAGYSPAEDRPDWETPCTARSSPKEPPAPLPIPPGASRGSAAPPHPGIHPSFLREAEDKAASPHLLPPWISKVQWQHHSRALPEEHPGVVMRREGRGWLLLWGWKSGSNP